ncbi:hypothetical protein [Nocardia nepalensis]|uniref:hypothetical protein n=1 Tax=Nocardia nepalensis TaxID=3375448 RepID=UPI003B683547
MLKTVGVQQVLSETLPAVTVEAAEVITLATTFVTEQIIAVGPARPDEAPELAAIVVRLMHSLTLTPDAPPLLRTESELREFAQRRIVPLVMRV